MKQQILLGLPALIALTCVVTVNPAVARGEGGRGEFTGRGLSTPRAGGKPFAGRDSLGGATRGSGRSPGGFDRAPRGPGRDGGRPRPGPSLEGRRRPTDRPEWDGRVPRRNRDRWYGHGSGWWYRRPYWGSFGYGGYFYDPFFSPFYSYGRFDDERENDRESEDNIEVRVKPDDAQVYVNGLLYSNRGKARFTLPAGPWSIELRAPGYRAERVEVNVEQGRRYRIERRLARDETFDRSGKAFKSEELSPAKR